MLGFQVEAILECIATAMDRKKADILEINDLQMN